MAQQTAYAVSFWDTVDEMRSVIFTDDDLALLEAIKPAERFEERIARLS
jgi:hypothetical protein